MLSRCLSLFRVLRHRPRATFLCAMLVILLAVAGWMLGRHFWAEYHLHAAREAIARKDFHEASTHLAACLTLRPDDGSVLLLAARCARRGGRYEEAEEQLHRCRVLLGPTPEVTLERALLSVQRGDLGENEGYLKATVGPDHPDAALVLEALAQGYAKTDRLLTLLECTDLWLHIQPESSDAQRWRGHAWERLGNNPAAVEAYRHALESDPRNDDARLGLAELLLERLGQPAAARSHFELLCQRQPDNLRARLGLARCQRRQGHLDEAEKTVADLLARQPEMPEALSERGQLALSRGRMQEAEDYLRKAVARAADDVEALYGLSQCLQAREKVEEARTYRERWHALQKDLNRLEEILPAIGKKPDDADLRCEAGVLCLRYGKEQDGLHWLRTALQVAPAHPATHHALADYYRERGQVGMAGEHLRFFRPTGDAGLSVGAPP